MKIDIVHITLVVPQGSVAYMDVLSDLRDSQLHGIVEWSARGNHVQILTRSKIDIVHIMLAVEPHSERYKEALSSEVDENQDIIDWVINPQLPPVLSADGNMPAVAALFESSYVTDGWDDDVTCAAKTEIKNYALS
jgi:hypothetical protein